MKHSAAIVISLMAGCIVALAMFIESHDSPWAQYLGSLRRMNALYEKGDIAGMVQEGGVADLYYRRCVVAGDIVILSIKDRDERGLKSVMAEMNMRPYASGAQNLGGQHSLGTYGIEKTDYAILLKDSVKFREIVARADVDKGRSAVQAIKDDVGGPRFPDYQKWLQIKIGMTIAQVKQVLGEPVEIFGENSPGWALTYNYGTLLKFSAQIPYDYKFQVNFLDGEVYNIEDPFLSGILRKVPQAAPVIYCPQPGTQFPQYPRLFDIRWNPVGGAYPMAYEVCVSIRMDDGKHGYTWDDTVVKTDLPYLSFCFAGANFGRVKVRTVNQQGFGPWSESVDFKFDH